MSSNQTEAWRGIVNVGDCPIYVALDGPIKAPPLMLSNSLGSDITMWEPQLADLSNLFRVIRYDSRGHGKSGVPQDSYTMERLGRDALRILDHFGIERTNWCGLSMGGMIGQWLGANEPSRLQKLILSNTTSYYADKRSWTTRIQLVQSNGINEVAAPSMERWFSADFREREPDTVTRATEMLIATNPDGYIGCCAAIRDMDHRALLSKISAQTLIIAGSLDVATPVDGHEFICSQVQGAKLAILAAAHLSNIEQPDAYTRTVLNFLRN
jgi:3-oxoadipate enol-lactonase